MTPDSSDILGLHKITGDLNVLHPSMLVVEDNTYQDDLKRFYPKLGVHSLIAEKIINNHIVPVLEKEIDEILKVCYLYNLYNFCIKFISETKSIYIKYIQNVVKNTHINTLYKKIRLIKIKNVIIA